MPVGNFNCSIKSRVFHIGNLEKLIILIKSSAGQYQVKIDSSKEMYNITTLCTTTCNIKENCVKNLSKVIQTYIRITKIVRTFQIQLLFHKKLIKEFTFRSQHVSTVYKLIFVYD